MDSPVPPREDIAKNNAPTELNQPLQRLWARLVSFGMADRVLRAASAVFTALMLAGVVLILSRFYASASGSTPAQQLPQESALSPTEPAFAARSFQKEPPQETKSMGIAPLVSLHTILPSRGRTELVSYVIQAGDTLFSIAEKFGLRPESILWGNRYTLGEDPHMIYPGQELLILPLDGTLHRCSDCGEVFECEGNCEPVADNDEIYCRECVAYMLRRGHLRRCEHCDQLLASEDSVVCVDGQYYCHDCYPEFVENNDGNDGKRGEAA